MSMAKDYSPVSLLSVISKAFENIVNNRLVDHLEKCEIFLHFQYSFCSSPSVADLLSRVSDEVVRVSYRCGYTGVVGL